LTAEPNEEPGVAGSVEVRPSTTANRSPAFSATAGHTWHLCLTTGEPKGDPTGLLAGHFGFDYVEVAKTASRETVAMLG
jgi:hypothetical protein